VKLFTRSIPTYVISDHYPPTLQAGSQTDRWTEDMQSHDAL